MKFHNIVPLLAALAALPLNVSAKEMVYEGYSSAIISKDPYTIFEELGEDQNPEHEADRCNRTLVLHGLNASIGALIGFIDAADQAGKPIDCIVASTGSSIAAAVQHVYQDPIGKSDALAKFVRETSDGPSTYYGILKPITVEKVEISQFEAAARYAYNNATLSETPFAMNLIDMKFGDTTMPAIKVPEGVIEASPLKQGFNPEAKIRVVLVGSYLDYGKSKQGKTDGSYFYIRDGEGKIVDESRTLPHDPSFKPVKEVYYTDTRTAKLLRGFKSQINRLFPNAMTAAETVVIDQGVSVGQAAMISASDPFLMKPVKLNLDPELMRSQKVYSDGYFFGGGINLNPWEVGRHITKRNGGELIMGFPGGRSPAEPEALQGAYGHRQEERMIYSVTALLALEKAKYEAVGGPDYWINLTSPDNHVYMGGDKAVGHHFTFDPVCYVLTLCSGGELMDLTELESSEYQARMDHQIAAGKYLMNEALANALKFDSQFVGHMAENFVSPNDGGLEIIAASHFDYVTYGNALQSVADKAEREEEQALKREAAKAFLDAQ